MLDPGGQGHEGDQHDVEDGGYRPVDGNEHGMLPSRSILSSIRRLPRRANQMDLDK